MKTQEEAKIEAAPSSSLPNLTEIDPARVENVVISSALERIKDRARPSHTSHWTKHTSFSRKK